MKLFLNVIIAICLLSCTSQSYASDKGIALAKKCMHAAEDELRIITCIGYETTLTSAYMELYFAYIERNPDKAWDHLRRTALSNIFQDPNRNEIHLSALKHALPNRKDLIALYEKAIIWADKEAAQSAEDLYARADTIANDLSDTRQIKGFKKLFLYLAEQKGHTQAAIDVEIMNEALWKRMEEDNVK